MKKQLLTAGAVTLLALSIGSGVASAATYDSGAKITFSQDTSITPPVDPINPDVDVTPKDPDGTDPNPGTSGPLSIDFASSFGFEDQVITTKDRDYDALPQALSDGTTRPNYVQVTDKRGGASGWSLQVKQDTQLTSATTNKALGGAYISLKNGTTATTTGSDAISPTIDNATTVLTIGEDGNGETQNLLNATDGQGAGTWVFRFGDDSTKATSVSLHVPGASTKYAEEYSANLTWTLANTPR